MDFIFNIVCHLNILLIFLYLCRLLYPLFVSHALYTRAMKLHLCFSTVKLILYQHFSSDFYCMFNMYLGAPILC